MADATISNEIWKDIPGFEGWYQVSPDGRVKSMARSTPTRNRWGPCLYNQPEKEIFGRIDSYGYRRFSVCVAGEVSSMFAHTAVALAFIGPRPSPEHQVAHWNGDKLNNHFSNLRWATPKENSQDNVRHGKTANQFGERHSHNKLTEDMVREIRRTPYYRGFNRAFAAKFNVTEQSIGKVRLGNRWPHIK
jgi:hypothetical protein